MSSYYGGSSESSLGSAREKGSKLRCWSKGSENLQQLFCMAISYDYTVYNFQIAHEERRWYIQKRFSAFAAMDDELNEQFPDVMISVQRLPPKKMLGSLDPALIAMRQKSLDAYLQSVLVRPALANSEPVLDFIEMPLDLRAEITNQERHLQAGLDAVRT